MNLFSTRDEAYHRDQKRLVAAAYSMSSLLEMEDAVDSCANLFIKRLDEFAAGGQAFDLGVSKLTSAFIGVASSLRLLPGLAPILCARRRQRAHFR